MNMRKMLTLLVVLAFVAVPLAGCLKGKDPVVEEDAEQKKAEAILGDQGQQKFDDLAAAIPKDYRFPGQAELPKVNVKLAGTATSEALGSYEAQRDEGGMEYNSVIKYEDVSAHIPAGQPVEMFIKLFWDGSEVNSADLDIAVDVPGLKTTYSSVTEDLNWNYASKSMVVNTVGVAGMPALVGVQIAGGAITEGFDYELQIEFTYVQNVLTPYHAWSFNVPEGASGIILESVRASGDEHVSAEFVVIDPEDNLLEYKYYDDIDIPTQSVFIPTKGKGNYVFYAYSMHGGFLRMKTDAPLEVVEATPLTLVEVAEVDSNAPAPGVAGKDVLEGSPAGGAMPTDDVNPTTKTFETTGTFPLRVTGYVKGQLQPMAKITISSPKGIVHEITSIGRYEDERGSLGYTSTREEGPNNNFYWNNIEKGSWTVSVVNNGNAEIGHTILTYTR